MRRRKRYTILRVALGLAIAASVPTAAQAAELGIRGQQSDDREYPAWATQMETPYWSMAGAGSSKGPDDRSFSRATTLDATPVVTDNGRNIDLNAYSVTVSALALLLAMGFGMGIGVWRSRKTNLSPA
jgi:hypothetical protein